MVCPSSGKKINLPARGKNCKHVDVFDLKGYLMLMEKEPTWKCGICLERAYAQDVQIDTYIF